MSNSSNSSNPSGVEPQATDESVTGAVRVSISRHGARPSTPVQEQPAGDRSIRISNTLSINTSTGEQTNMNTTRVVVGGAADPSGASGVLATARSAVFHGPVSQITDKTIVTIPGEDGSPGYDVPVRVAVGMGYLVKRGDGTYAETTKAERETAEATKRAAAEAQQRAEAQPSSAGDVTKMTTQAFAPDIQRDLDQITQGRSQDEWGPVLAEFLHNGNLDRVVGRLGMGREQAQVFVAVAQEACMTQAQEALRDILGDDLEGWAAWCAENKPQEYRRAVMNHVHAKTVDGYRSLAQEFLRSVPPSAEMLQRSGYETKQEGGELMVRLDGAWQSVRAATKQGAFALPRFGHNDDDEGKE